MWKKVETGHLVRKPKHIKVYMKNVREGQRNFPQLFSDLLKNCGCRLFFKIFDDRVNIPGKIFIVVNGIFDFVYRMKNSGMMFSPEFIADFIEGVFG
jgi:hypothetical protein